MLYHSSIIVILAAFILLYHNFRAMDYGKWSAFYSVLMLPALFFSTNMLTDAVTTDEMQYMRAFSNPLAVEPYSVIWNKGTNQYRTTEIVECTIFRVWRAIYPELSENTAFVAYKIVHWFMFFIIILLISYIWARYIIDLDQEKVNYRMTNFGLLYMLLGLPVSCLMLKVCNYDAGNVYFAILGLSLCIAAEKQKRPVFAYMGVLASTFGTMEKWVSLMYWCICVSLFAFLLMKECGPIREKLKKSSAAILLSIVSSSMICIIALLYLRGIYGRGIIDFTFEKALHPLFYELKFFARYVVGITTGKEIDINNGINLVLPFAAITVFLFLFSWIIDITYKFFSKRGKKDRTVIVNINSILGGALVIVGVIGVYTTVRYQFLPDTNGLYIPKAGVNGTIVSYGAKTKFGHYLALLANEYGIVFADYPTAILVMIFASYFVMTKKYKGEYILQLVLSSTMMIIAGFGVFGQLGATRYLAVQIILISMIAVYYLGKCDFSQIRLCPCLRNRKWVTLVLGLYLFEMALYLPVFNCFCPLWIVRSEEFKNTVRKGQKVIGESMTWGEELAIAGKIIEENQNENQNDDVTIYTDYGGAWLSNPGYKVIGLKNVDANVVSFTEHAYFVFSKFVMFRMEIPPFVGQMEPYEKIQFNGETTVWIYRGDQLVEYQDLNYAAYGK